MSVAAVLLYQAGGLGITAGAHRLWAHRSYKAKWPLRLLLVIFNTLAFQVGNKNCEHCIFKSFKTSTPYLYQHDKGEQYRQPLCLKHKMHTKFWLENLTGRQDLEDLVQ